MSDIIEAIETLRAAASFIKEHAGEDISAASLEGALHELIEKQQALLKPKEKTQEQLGAEAAKLVLHSGQTGINSDFANGFVTELTQAHRTHQQAAGRVINSVLIKYAKRVHDTEDYDLRNEAFAKHAADYRKQYEYVPLPYI